MKKLQVHLPAKDWGTTKTKYPPDSIYVGPDEFTAGSQNFDTQKSGVITKRLGGVIYNPNSLLANPAKDQYEAIFSDGAHHLLVVQNGTLEYSSGNGIFNTVTSGYTPTGNFEFSEYLDRVYFDNGIDTPQVYDRATSYGGVTYTAPKTKNMGAQAPTTALTAALNVDSTTNQVPAGAHTYKVTFLYYGFEESNGSPASNLVTNDATHTSNSLTNIPIGGYGVTARNIYRDNNDGLYALITTITDNTTTTYTDRSPVGTTPIPTDNGTPPTFSYITTYLSRLWLAGVPGQPSTIFFSAAGLPDIYNGAGFIVCNASDPIKALVVFQGQLLVFNFHSVGTILGSSSSSFQYQDIEPTVGCIDTRSIQTRVINGVPTLIWLSDKGFYGYNGSSFQYLSDEIEDLVNFNIQQGQVVKGQNSQSTQTQFESDTSSPAIDLISDPGIIQTINPTRTFQSEADWESGSSLTNIATHNTENTLQIPIAFQPTIDSGTFNNTINQSGNITIAGSSNFTGESHLSPNIQITPTQSNYAIAQSVSVPRAGTINSVTIRMNVGSLSVYPATIRVWQDSFGQPGTLLGMSNVSGTTGVQNLTASFSISIASAQTIWIGISSANLGGSPLGYTTQVFMGSQQCLANGDFSGGYPTGAWGTSGADGLVSLACGYSFTITPSAQSGTWTSPIYDSNSDSISTTMQFYTAGIPSYPDSTTISAVINGSNNADMSLPNTTETLSNPVSGGTFLTTSGSRYWQIVLTLSTPNDTNVPSITPVQLLFAMTGTWISPAIDRTSDIITDDSLTINSTAPVGTSITVTVATSANNITYTSFVPYGTQVVQRYMKIKAVLTTSGLGTVSPFITSMILDWSVSATIESVAIDTGANPPAGWDIFQSTFFTNGGSVSYQFRTASSSGGLPSATYMTVTNGQIPTNTPLEFCQWKITLVAHANQVPQVENVTVNWFISIIQSSRVASVFYNRTYYIAAATLGNSINNIILVYDDFAKWRIYKGISASTMGLFFNNPFYGNALNGQFIKWIQGTTDNGTNIDLNLRTKAFDFGSMTQTKIMRKLYVKLLNTGAVYSFSYSVDGGMTFNPLIVETQNGSTTLTTDTSGTLAFHRLLPSFTSSETGPTMQGKTIMIQIDEQTANPVEIHELTTEAWVRKGELLQTS